VAVRLAGVPLPVSQASKNFSAVSLIALISTPLGD
jgi:hypothetical protein